jgi:hypothetical protein
MDPGDGDGGGMGLRVVWAVFPWLGEWLGVRVGVDGILERAVRCGC